VKKLATAETNQRKPMKTPIIRRKFALFMYIMVWVLTLATFSGLVIIRASQYNELRASLDVINTDIAREQSIYYDLNRQMFFFDSDAYIEQLARERLGMILPNEILFRNIAE